MGADLKMLRSVLEADERVEQTHHAQLFNLAGVVPVSG